MGNVTEDENHKAIQEFFCAHSVVETNQEIIIAAFNIPLSITAFLGNVLIIAALQKVSSLHPPSKLLLGCLASTDICVGLITQPLFVAYKMSQKHLNSKNCYYIEMLFHLTSVMFGGVSLLTLTAISVDRLLALLLGLNYKQVVTLKRAWVLVVIFWLSCPACLTYSFYNNRVVRSIISIVVPLCIVITISCYAKIYVTLQKHQAQIQDHVSQGQPNGGGSPLNIARYRKTVSSTLWIQMTLVACYFPFFVANAALAITGSLTQSVSLALTVTSSMVYFNSSINPLLYCWKMREVREGVKDTIRQVLCLSS